MKFPKLIFRKTVPLVGADKQGISRVPVQIARELINSRNATIINSNPVIIGLRQAGKACTEGINRINTTNPLKNLISMASLFASRNSRSAMLNSILFKIEDGTLCVMATDLKSHFVGYLEPGDNYSFTHDEDIQAVCINARHLGKILSSQNDKFNLHVIKGKENPILRIGEFLIEGEDASGFPEIQIPKKTDKEYPFAVEDVGRKLTFVSRAASVSKYKAALSGIYLDIARQQLVGADGNRLHLTPMNESEKNLDVKHAAEGVIVPASILKAAKLLTGIGRIIASGNMNRDACQYVNFALNIPGCNDCTVTLQTIDGQFPKYEDVIPKEFASRFVARTHDLLPVLNKALVANTADSDSKPVLVEFRNGQMAVTVNIRGRVVYRGVVQGQYSGALYRGIINAGYLTDAIEGMQCDSIEILLQSKNDQAWVIRDGSGYIAVVMPIEMRNQK